MDQRLGVIGDLLSWALSNFGLTMFLLAGLFILLHRYARHSIQESEIVYRWVALFGLGVDGIYTFIMHVFYPDIAAEVIGWQISPFQYEVGVADLAFGVLGIFSFRASYGFRLATVVGSSVWLLGDALGHVWRLVEYNNFSTGNAGTWLWMDIIVPLILILCIRKMKTEG